MRKKEMGGIFLLGTLLKKFHEEKNNSEFERAIPLDYLFFLFFFFGCTMRYPIFMGVALRW